MANLPVIPGWEKAYEADASYVADCEKARKVEHLAIDTTWGEVTAEIVIDEAGA